MDPDLGVLRYIARYQAHNHGRVTWYSPRFIDQDECILRYGNLVKALRALEQKGYLDPVPGGSPGLPGYRLSPAGEALLAANDTSDDSGRSE